MHGCWWQGELCFASAVAQTRTVPSLCLDGNRLRACVTCVQRAKPQPDSLFCQTVTIESAWSEIHTTYTHAQQNIQVLSDSYPQLLSRANTLSQMKYSPPWTHMPQSVRGKTCLGRKEIMHTYLYITHSLHKFRNFKTQPSTSILIEGSENLQF